jgi:hypothetical protein
MKNKFQVGVQMFKLDSEIARVDLSRLEMSAKGMKELQGSDERREFRLIITIQQGQVHVP